MDTDVVMAPSAKSKVPEAASDKVVAAGDDNRNNEAEMIITNADGTADDSGGCT